MYKKNMIDNASSNSEIIEHKRRFDKVVWLVAWSQQ